MRFFTHPAVPKVSWSAAAIATARHPDIMSHGNLVQYRKDIGVSKSLRDQALRSVACFCGASPKIHAGRMEGAPKK